MLRKGAFASIVLLLALVCAFGVVGCKSQKSSVAGAPPASQIVGTWAASNGSGITWQFTKDGKLIQSTGEFTGTGQNSTESTGTRQSSTSGYTLSGNVLTITPAFGDTKHGVEATLTIQWVSSDQFQIPMGSQTLGFTRQK